jgi:hypothetical protein
MLVMKMLVIDDSSLSDNKHRRTRLEGAREKSKFIELIGKRKKTVDIFT